VAAYTPELALMQLRSQHGPQNYNTVCGLHRAMWPYINQLPEPQRTEAEKLLVEAHLLGSKQHRQLLQTHLNLQALKEAQCPSTK